MLDAYRAVKRVAKNQVGYDQLMKEVHILKSLNHPNIPIIYDIEEDAEYSYIIEEYLEGESLRAYRLHLSHMDERSVLGFTFQICDLILYLHTLESSVLYLDLKPDNILISKGKLKLLDFGAAVYERQYADAGCYLATLSYAAPERLRNVADQRSDIYSIGCLLYVLVTGANYQPSYIARKWAGIFIRNRRIYKLMEQCLKTEPSERFQSVEELMRKVEQLSSKGKLYNKSAVMSYRIGIAGSEPRVGVSHTALALASYVNMVYHNVAYVEKNNTGFLKRFARAYPGVKKKENYLMVNGIWLLEQEVQGENHFTITDYGVLTMDNLQDFLEQDYLVVVVGGKPWEIEAAKRIWNLLCDCEKVLYIVNGVPESAVWQEYRQVYPRKSIMEPALQGILGKELRPKDRKFLDSVISYVVEQ